MRFHLDEDLSGRIAEIGRSRGLDIVSSLESGINGKGDEDQLVYAASQGRCLVTCDVRDFTRVNLRFIEAGLVHSGILVLTSQPPARAFGRVVEALARFAAEHPEGLNPNAMAFLRIR